MVFIHTKVRSGSKKHTENKENDDTIAVSYGGHYLHTLTQSDVELCGKASELSEDHQRLVQIITTQSTLKRAGPKRVVSIMCDAFRKDFLEYSLQNILCVVD